MCALAVMLCSVVTLDLPEVPALCEVQEFLRESALQSFCIATTAVTNVHKQLQAKRVQRGYEEMNAILNADLSDKEKGKKLRRVIRAGMDYHYLHEKLGLYGIHISSFTCTEVNFPEYELWVTFDEQPDGSMVVRDVRDD